MSSKNGSLSLRATNQMLDPFWVDEICSARNERLFAESSQKARSETFTGIETVVLAPGSSVTRWKPSSRLIGRCAEAGAFGWLAYSWTTSEPAFVPVLVTVAVAVSESSAVSEWLESCRLEYLNVV